MSTVPKFTYAKVGKGSKAKAQSASSQLIRSKQQKSDDIFSQMNQENLNYIKKQLKLKKNRSQHQPPRSYEENQTDGRQQQDEQTTQRYKLYQKYRGDQEVSQKQPHLEDTQRRSEEGRGVGIVLPEDMEEDYDPEQGVSPIPFSQEKHFISSSHHGIITGKFQEKLSAAEHKMYQSLPYEDGKKRMASIQGFFGQAISTNLNRQEGQFIQFLEQYICDLNQSKNLKSRQNDEISIQKHRNTGFQSQRRKTNSRQGSQKRYNTKTEKELKQNIQKLDRLNRNSDTFGQHNSKFTVKSQQSNLSEQRNYAEQQQKLKQQKLKTILLAQEIEKQRKLLAVKQDIIKKLQTDNQLFKEELRHVKMQQQILGRGKQSVPQLGFSRNAEPYKQRKTANDQNGLAFFDAIPKNHQRDASSIPQRTAVSYRSSIRHPDEAQLFQQFAGHHHSNVPAGRQKKSKKEKNSVQKWESEYSQFLQQSKPSQKASRGDKRY